MSPRRSAQAASQTRDAILARAVDVASVEGLEGLTIGRLAADLGLSKSGLLGHFGSKEALQLAALGRAVATFEVEVWQRCAAARPGRTRLVRLCEAWLSYLERDVFPGGCFVTAASSEFDGRPGPVREALAHSLERWTRLLEADARVAVRGGELPTGTDPEQLAFELHALFVGANQRRQLLGDDRAVRRARSGMRSRLAAPQVRGR